MPKARRCNKNQNHHNAAIEEATCWTWGWPSPCPTILLLRYRRIEKRALKNIRKWRSWKLMMLILRFEVRRRCWPGLKLKRTMKITLIGQLSQVGQCLVLSSADAVKVWLMVLLEWWYSAWIHLALRESKINSKKKCVKHGKSSWPEQWKTRPIWEKIVFIHEGYSERHLPDNSSTQISLCIIIFQPGHLTLDLIRTDCLPLTRPWSRTTKAC